jgi:glycosyltransferase involved in cell wall biosynthesis
MIAELPIQSTGKENGTERKLSYVLITPARNEAAFVEEAIKSVVRQTVLPLKWVIVDDGSTDGTSAIVRGWTLKYDWIEHIALPPRTERHFAGKVTAFTAGYDKVRALPHDVVGSLDADVSFDDPEYFAFLLDQFARDPRLGVAGAPFREANVQYDYRFSRKEHVSGACQLFRRECFESIGGYVPLKMGAIDLAANVSARMKGWRTETFPEKFCVHHRRMGTAKDRFIAATFKSGYGDYRMGVHPLWQLFRSIYQMSRKPIVSGGVILLAGYLWAMATRAAKPVSAEFVNFRGEEQKQWLKDYFRKIVGRSGQRLSQNDSTAPDRSL